jgi:hypothetical protein
MPDDRSLALDAPARRLRAALAAVLVKAPAPELRVVHRWLDTWTSVRLITVGVERLGHRLALTHVADAEWRAAFTGHPLFAPVGYGVAPTPSGAVQRAAWAVAVA